MNRSMTVTVRMLFGLLLLVVMAGAWRSGAPATARQEATPTTS